LLKRPDSIQASAGKILLLTLLCAAGAMAAVHSIKFRSDEDVTFSPKVFTAQIGDTVKWEGAFDAYPLKSEKLPAGAPAWAAAKGKVFSYVVKVPGKYNYWCYPTAAGKQICSFTVADSGTKSGAADDTEHTLQLGEITSDPTLPDRQILNYDVGMAQEINLSLYTEDGKLVLKLADGFKNPGHCQAVLPFRQLAPGFYICRLEGSDTDIKKLHLEKTSSDSLANPKNAKFHIEK
jgi:plastocyanin